MGLMAVLGLEGNIRKEGWKARKVASLACTQRAGGCPLLPGVQGDSEDDCDPEPEPGGPSATKTQPLTS